ncbi:hypothetical protein GUT184_02570 [Streptococcus ruminantium]|nr:hypothetical protein GUT184_02570 [Streptococcus ruminantium]
MLSVRVISVSFWSVIVSDIVVAVVDCEVVSVASFGCLPQAVKPKSVRRSKEKWFAFIVIPF